MARRRGSAAHGAHAAPPSPAVSRVRETYCMAAAAMSLELHGCGSHAVWMGGTGQRAWDQESREHVRSARAPGVMPEIAWGLPMFDLRLPALRWNCMMAASMQYGRGEHASPRHLHVGDIAWKGGFAC